MDYATSDSTAINGINYNGTSGSLLFHSNQVHQSFNISILHNPQITGDKVFFVTLSNPTSPGLVVTPSSVPVTVIDDDSGFSFVAATNSVGKLATNAVVSVIRQGNTATQASVNFATAGGTAVSGVEYTATNGVLSFSSGQSSNSFVIPIINDNQIDGDQTVNLTLSNPSAGTQLLAPTNQVLTIVDVQSGISFSSSTYTVNEDGVSAVITVLRSGVTNDTVSVFYQTFNGTATNGLQYVATSGTLVFTNGQTSKTFSVPIIDNRVVGGAETVLLQLSAPSTTASLVNPGAATLTILNNDDSDIVAAGSALISPATNIINPGATVTMLLALRDAAGRDASNVVATLLATNGVTPFGSQVQNYGNLVVNGSSVFRPFTFTVANTNGAIVSATLRLQYGVTNFNTVSFNYTLGSATNYFTNSAPIIINDNVAATPYPSGINISSLVGVITKVTATVSNLAHTYISDVQMLLVSPNGQKELLMERTGGSFTITNVTLTFDSAAANSLNTNAPVSGTYKPSPLQTSIPFPAQTNSQPAPAGPYNFDLGDFVGTNPNGLWSLYVADTKTLDVGSINNGWTLAVSTLSVLTPNVDLSVGISAPASVVLNSNLTYTISVTNAGPSPATGITVSNSLTAGLAFVSASVAHTNIGNSIILNIGSLATNGVANVTLVVAATNGLGTVTNSISVGGNEFENYSANNSTAITTSIISPSADLAIGVVDSPNPVALGAYLTNIITVTNLGPGTANGVIITNIMPSGFILLSNLSTTGVTNTGGVLTVSATPGGVLGNGSVGTVFIVIAATNINTVGVVTNTFGVTSSVSDPLKGNNNASVKTIVQFVPLTSSFSANGKKLTFTWPATANGYTLQYATNLPTTNWLAVTNAIITNGSTATVTITNLTPGPKGLYYRLKQ